jgi:flagellin-like protein
MTEKGQSNVVGVALLLGVTVVALGTLTASVGTVVDSHAASADASRVAADLDRAVRPVETTGVNRGRVSFTAGRLRTVEREVRVLDERGVVATVDADALRFETGQRRVTVLAGAIVTERRGTADLYRRPPVTASRSAGVLVVGVAALNGSVDTGGAAGGSVVLRAEVTHDRTVLGDGTYRVAVETDAPGPWESFFEREDATVLPRRDFDGDGTASVVARYPGNRTGYLVVHDVEVSLDG